MKRALTSAFALALAALPLQAANTSDYTKFTQKDCRTVDKANEAEEYSGTWACKGYKGKPDYEIYQASGDLRDSMAFGRDGKNHCAMHQSFSGFNSANTTVEWRLSNGKPIAAIVRWTVSYDPENSEKTHTWLVITKLEGKNSCHMAYVQGGLPKANEKAREVADTMAPGFSCKTGVLKTFALPETSPEETPSGPSCPQQ